MVKMILPNAEQFDKLIEAVNALKENDVEDYTGSPGSKKLITGDRTNGFYGFVQPSEFGEITANADGFREFNGSNLALAVGLTSGVAFQEKPAWMKFTRNGKILFAPVIPLRRNVVWEALYNSGIVNGDSSVGLPKEGRSGKSISANATTNSFTMVVSGIEGFTSSGSQVANVGDVITVSGFKKVENNGDFTVSAITNTEISVTGRTLVTESGNENVKLYNKSKAVVQNKILVIGGRQYAVRLLSGTENNPTNSYANLDRDANNSEWNKLILPLMVNASTGYWDYNRYAQDVENWGVNLTDANLMTKQAHGLASITWCQDVRDDSSVERIVRGFYGASYITSALTNVTSSNYGWRPVLELLN